MENTQATHSRAMVIGLGILASVVTVWVFVLGQPGANISTDGIPMPFVTRTSLKGSVVDIGTRNGLTVTDVTFDNGETAETLPVNKLNFVLTPNSDTMSHGAPLSVALTSGKKIFGYKYTSRNAADEIANMNASTFAQRFSGEFFVSSSQRAFDSYIATFESQNGVTFKDLREVTLDRNARYIIIANDSDTSVTIRNLTWFSTPLPVCGNGILEADEDCDDGNTQDNDRCSNSCRLVGSDPWLPPSAVCGNLIQEAGEECDIDSPSCDDTCRIIVNPLY